MLTLDQKVSFALLLGTHSDICETVIKGRRWEKSVPPSFLGNLRCWSSRNVCLFVFIFGVNRWRCATLFDAELSFVFAEKYLSIKDDNVRCIGMNTLPVPDRTPKAESSEFQTLEITFFGANVLMITDFEPACARTFSSPITPPVLRRCHSLS